MRKHVITPPTNDASLRSRARGRASTTSKHHHLLWSALSAGALLLGCDQPAPKCTVARGYFSATYTLVSGEGECAELKGEVLGVQAYSGQQSARDTAPDYDKGSIGIQPQGITDLLFSGREPADPESGDQPFALGSFSSAEPKGDFCAAPTLSVARLELGEVPEQTEMCPPLPAEPAVSIRYEFSNVRVYTTASAIGTQLSADLTYTKDGCTATYRVAAVYPSVSCEVPPAVEETPAEETPTEEPPPEELPADDDAGVAEDASCPEAEEPELPEEPLPEPVLDEKLCAPVANAAEGRPIGSGINPDFAIRCDPDLRLCVLNEEPPSLR